MAHFLLFNTISRELNLDMGNHGRGGDWGRANWGRNKPWDLYLNLLMDIDPHSLLLLYYLEFELDFSNFVLSVQIQPFQMIKN